MPSGRGSELVPGPFVSASELSDWVFCPRAHHYRGHPPPGGEDLAASVSRAAGTRFHGRYLAHEVSASRPARGLWVLGALGALLLLVALALLVVG